MVCQNTLCRGANKQLAILQESDNINAASNRGAILFARLRSIRGDKIFPQKNLAAPFGGAAYPVNRVKRAKIHA